MGATVTEFVEFDATRYGGRYTFDVDNRAVWDTKFSRNLTAGCKRGGRPYYRLVREDGEAEHVRAEDIFGEGANEDIPVESDFEPSDFSHWYTFDFETPAVIRNKGKGPKSGQPMKLHSPGGWKHWLLTRNDGVRVCVTPAEVLKAGKRDVWEVRPLRGSKVFESLFPDHCFTREGQIYRIRSKSVLLSPEPCPVDRAPEPGSKSPDQDTRYRLVSKSGKEHVFTRASIKELFKPQPDV